MNINQLGLYWDQADPNSADRIKYDSGSDAYIYYTDESNGSGSNFRSFSFPSNTKVTPPPGSPYDSANYQTRAAIDSATGSITALILFKPGQTNTQIALTYTSFGVISFVPPNGFVGNNHSIYDQAFAKFFVFGTPGPACCTLTGTASFSGISVGAYQDSTGTYLTSGTSSLMADFGAGTVTTSLSFTGKNITPGGADLATVTLNGAGRRLLADVDYSGELHNAAGTIAGDFYGHFFGGNAEEYGYVYRIRNATERDPVVNGAGVAVGKR